MEPWILDGIGRNQTVACRICDAFAKACQMQMRETQMHSAWLQQDAHSCGVIALAHAAVFLQGKASDAQLDWAQGFLQSYPEDLSQLRGLGGLSESQMQALSSILQEHGVAAADTEARIQSAVAKLNAGPVAEALASRNPWQAMKAAGSRPGVRFMWVLPAELQAHIATRAAQKFGAGIANAKANKQKTPGKRLTKAPLHVDPQQLQLAAGSFVSESG